MQLNKKNVSWTKIINLKSCDSFDAVHQCSERIYFLYLNKPMCTVSHFDECIIELQFLGTF